jgi:wobble nucleotide-excising tRNase
MASFNSSSSSRANLGTIERPTTAASSNRKVLDLENELKNERKMIKKFNDEVDSLKKEIHK